MTDATELLALRKQLLQARAVLFRLRIRRDAREVRAALRPARIVHAAAGSAPVKIALLGMALAFVPATRVSGLFRVFLGLLQLTRMAGTLRALWQPAKSRAACVRQRTDRAVIDL